MARRLRLPSPQCSFSRSPPRLRHTWLKANAERLLGQFSLWIEGIAGHAIRRSFRPILRMAALADLAQVIGCRSEFGRILGFGGRANCQRRRLHVADPGLPIRIGHPFAIVLTGTRLGNERGGTGEADGILIDQEPVIIVKLFRTLGRPNAIGRNLHGSPHEIQNTDRHGGRRPRLGGRRCGPCRPGEQDGRCEQGRGGKRGGGQDEGGGSGTPAGRHSVIHRKLPNCGVDSTRPECAVGQVRISRNLPFCLTLIALNCVPCQPSTTLSSPLQWLCPPRIRRLCARKSTAFKPAGCSAKRGCGVCSTIWPRGPSRDNPPKRSRSPWMSLGRVRISMSPRMPWSGFTSISCARRSMSITPRQATPPIPNCTFHGANIDLR